MVRRGIFVAAEPCSHPAGKGTAMTSPLVRHLLRISVRFFLAMLSWTSPVSAADVCVTLDETRDTFSVQDRSAALLLLARQFELAGEHVVTPGCANAYVVSHIQFGSRISVLLTGPKGEREATAIGMDDVPNVYSQMVRSLIRGVPMDAQGVVDRSNVSDVQSAAPNRIHSDSLYYARLGYGAVFGDDTYGGPSVGLFGYRHERNRMGVDVSFLNFQHHSAGSAYAYGSSTTGTWLKLEVLHFVKPASDRSLYFGGGLSWSTTDLDTDLQNGYTSWHGNGLQGELTGGLEIGRASSILVFIQTDIGLPFYELTGESYLYAPRPQMTTSRQYAPSLSISLGLGWLRGKK